MEKKYVNPKLNKLHKCLHDFIGVNDTVIVVDGSYIVEANNEEPTRGIDFVKRVDEVVMYELLTVTRINMPFKTHYLLRDVLSHHNNCEIQSANGNRFYCSLLNIRRFA